jgi:hypothetical protein
MLALITRPQTISENYSNRIERTLIGWKQRAWRCIIDWLTEPIPFPGQWPVSDQRQTRYNRVVDPQLHERSTTQS